MSSAGQTPDWAPPESGEGFAVRVIPATPASAPPVVAGARRSRAIDPEALAEAIRAGDRGALARGITLIESRAPAHQSAAQAMLTRLLPHAGGARRVGVTGVPGAGKSTFIEALGMLLCARGQRVAVLSVDPSSPVSHGSILGDKTRMERLSREERAYIRPSPSGGELGGVARATRETITLCEAAGFDVVLVETVGVGQSEVVVRGMVDCFLVLLIAGAGDELQGIKKGILELADLLAVNKADGDNRIRAEATRLEMTRALHYLAAPEGEAWHPRVLACSAQTGEGIARLWAEVEAFFACAARTGTHASRRRAQSLAWLESLVRHGLADAFAAHPAVAAERASLEAAVAANVLPAPAAAERLLQLAGLRRSG